MVHLVTILLILLQFLTTAADEHDSSATVVLKNVYVAKRRMAGPRKAKFSCVFCLEPPAE
ncbi:MAG: hypothetical protein A2Y77_05400 [Planctomycetes bacterium RBG_13_62_9]|nr:MAG: hypothetical protein A2Y77_05400 [Planctomycetes bacterium RBG_13_62_9]